MPSELFGVACLIGSIVTVGGYLAKSDRWVALGSWSQVLIWLFVSSVYLVLGHPFFGLAFGIPWALVFVYTSYLFTNRHFILSELTTVRERSTKRS